MKDLNRDFLIRPLGALYFGRPQSFFAGEAHRARSLFPPPQSAFQGMVRSQLLRAAGVDFRKDGIHQRISELVGTPDELPSDWQLRGPFPATMSKKGLQPWLPAPRYLVATSKGEAHPGLLVGRPLDTVGGLPMRASVHQGGSGNPPVLVGRPDRSDVKGPAEGWVAPHLLRELLAGEKSEWPHVSDKDWAAPWPPFVHAENRPGLGLQRPDEENPGIAAHGMLYFQEQVRIVQKHGRPAGFYGWLEAPKVDGAIPNDALTQDLGMAGRKGMPVAFEAVECLAPDWKALLEGDYLPEKVEENQRFWLTAFTPVRPTDLWSPVRERILPDGVELVVEAVLAGKVETFGGLRMADRRSRANRAFLPAGSSWLVRLKGGDPGARAQALKALHGNHPLGRADEAAFGHGFILVGICKEERE